MALMKLYTKIFIFSFLACSAQASFETCLKNPVFKSKLCAPAGQVEEFCEKIGSTPEAMDTFIEEFKKMKDIMGVSAAANSSSDGTLWGASDCQK
jgi:hypothetical protein